MATPQQALDDLKAAILDVPIRIRIEVVQRLTKLIEEQQRDQREQRIETEVQEAQALPSHGDLRVNDLREYVAELQAAFE